MYNPWLRLWLDLWRLGAEAQSVMALRLMRLAAGGAVAQREAIRMVTEKGTAAGSAGLVAVTALATGKSQQAAGRKALSQYRKRVGANRRRLSR